MEDFYPAAVRKTVLSEQCEIESLVVSPLSFFTGTVLSEQCEIESILKCYHIVKLYLVLSEQCEIERYYLKIKHLKLISVAVGE